MPTETSMIYISALFLGKKICLSEQITICFISFNVLDDKNVLGWQTLWGLASFDENHVDGS